MRCLLTGTQFDVEAAHIIPFCQCEYDKKYETSNGLLLNIAWHRRFDAHSWTIIRHGGHVVAIKSFELDDDDSGLYDIQNGTPVGSKLGLGQVVNETVGDKEIQYHNGEFIKKHHQDWNVNVDYQELQKKIIQQYLKDLT
jgi:hypothetical protein